MSMSEMPPGGHNRPQPPPMTPTRQGMGFDRGYLFSIPGILTLVAVICSFCAMVSVEVAKSQIYGYSSAEMKFHEFTTITSWLTLLIFTGVATMQLYRVASIRGSVMKFIMIGHSATWSLMTLISSAIILDGAIKLSSILSFPALNATGAFGLLECFALMGVTVLLVLDLLNIYRTPLFE